MAFIPVRDKVDTWVTLKNDHESFSGKFEAGTRVKVINKTERGYDIEDEEGNIMYECGWDL